MKRYLILFMIGITTVSSSAAQETVVTPVDAYRSVVKSADTTNYSKAARQLRRWMVANDPHYPVYHFTSPVGWFNDPHPIYYRGKYHVFYNADFFPTKRRPFDNICWGHVVSDDLVHWVDWPVAIWPDTQYDRRGVYSGNMFVDNKGNLCGLYTGNVGGHGETYGMLVRSMDGGLSFQKKMVMDNRQRPNANSPVHWDGYLWKEGDTWCQLIGGSTGGKTAQGAAWLWKSSDLIHWELQTNIAPAIRLGKFWELPYLIKLDRKHVLMVGLGNPYWIGSYNKKTMVFTPDESKPRYIDAGNYYAFNPNMIDDKGPGGGKRRILHAWVTGPRTPTKAVPSWQGASAIPRVLRLAGNRIWQDPIPEIQALRGKHYSFSDRKRKDLFRDIKSDSLELKATFAPGSAKRFGIKLRVSPDGREFTRVYFDTASRTFGVDGQALKKGRQQSYLKPEEDVTMHIFLDRSIVEVYVNGSAQTARTFPAPEALGLDIFSEGGEATLESLDIWEMKSMWE